MSAQKNGRRRAIQQATAGRDKPGVLSSAGSRFPICHQCGLSGLQTHDKERLDNAASLQEASERQLQAGGTGKSTITTQTEVVGGGLYRFASLPFEVASLILLVAIIGSVMLARTLRQEASVDDLSPDLLQREVGRDPPWLSSSAKVNFFKRINWRSS